MFELQARWVARVLSGAVALPAQGDMEHAIAQAASRLAPAGALPRRHAHAMTLEEQFEYDDRCGKCGIHSTTQRSQRLPRLLSAVRFRCCAACASAHRRLADAAGSPRLPVWRRAMYAENSRNKRAQPDTYRDVWDDAASAS
jgi:hypothetical protein